MCYVLVINHGNGKVEKEYIEISRIEYFNVHGHILFSALSMNRSFFFASISNTLELVPPC